MADMRGRRDREAEAQDAFRAVILCERRGRSIRTEQERAALAALSVLDAEGRTGIVDAVREIYGRVGTVEDNVIRYCTENFVARATVYRWLRMARDIYVAIRYPRGFER